MEIEKKRHRIDLILVVVILIGVSVFYLIRGGGGNVSFDLTETAFTLYSPEETSTEIALDNIRSIEYRETFAPGNCVDGGSEGGYSWGTWENDEFGRYQLYILTRVPAAIIIREKDGAVTACNFENTQTTEEFCKSLRQYCRDKGYDV